MNEKRGVYDICKEYFHTLAGSFYCSGSRVARPSAEAVRSSVATGDQLSC